jgi:hypothetical protein
MNRVLTALALVVLYACAPQPKSALQPGADLVLGMPTDTTTLELHAADTFRLGLDKGGFVFGNAN